MTRMNSTQEALLDAVKTTYRELMPVLQKLEDDYEFAVYTAKRGLRDAIDSATAGGVPMRRITEDGTGFQYPQKLKNFLRPSDRLAHRLVAGETGGLEESIFTETVESIEGVTRDPNTGDFTVFHKGDSYKVKSFGSGADIFSVRDSNVPDEVYAVIGEHHSGYVVMDDDEE